jgi:uncharacterized protein with HEPN domain
MKGLLSDKVRIQHILDAISAIEGYIEGVTEDQFIANSEKRFATIKQIEIIGEACNRISTQVKDANSEVPWAQIIGFRNISIHEYFSVSFHIVWGIAVNDLPVLKKQLLQIVKELA